VGAVIVRVPPPGWAPEGYVAPTKSVGLITRNDVYVYDALKTPQFWLIWWVLCLNVTAGIGVLGQASAMSQEMFPGHITPVAAAGFVGLMSLFNMGGRFFWASMSDYIGRRNTYFVFMVLGFCLYCTVPYAGSTGSVALFVCCFLIIISMYGGGFATVPAYLRDMFGTRYVGAIHGLLLTAWSAAGIFGPVLVNYIREYNVTHGVPKAQAYNSTMYIMAGLLVIGFICNFFVKAVAARFHMRANDPRAHDAVAIPSATAGPAVARAEGRIRNGNANRQHDEVQSRAGLDIRRHPAHVGRAADAGECNEAVPVAARF
jgi:MFS family permease